MKSFLALYFFFSSHVLAQAIHVGGPNQKVSRVLKPGTRQGTISAATTAATTNTIKSGGLIALQGAEAKKAITMACGSPAVWRPQTAGMMDASDWEIAPNIVSKTYSTKSTAVPADELCDFVTISFPKTGAPSINLSNCAQVVHRQPAAERCLKLLGL